MNIKHKIATATAFAAPALSALAEGETGGESAASAIPGLENAINTAQSTAEQMASQVVPAAVTILFAFAGLIGVWLVWRVFRKGAGGR